MGCELEFCNNPLYFNEVAKAKGIGGRIPSEWEMITRCLLFVFSFFFIYTSLFFIHKLMVKKTL